jgi:hypothetical protein
MKLFYGFVLCKNFDKSLITDDFIICDVKGQKYDSLDNNLMLCYEVENMGSMVASICMPTIIQELEDKNDVINKEKNKKLRSVFRKIYSNKTKKEIEDNEPFYFII